MKRSVGDSGKAPEEQAHLLRQSGMDHHPFDLTTMSQMHPLRRKIFAIFSIRDTRKEHPCQSSSRAAEETRDRRFVLYRCQHFLVKEGKKRQLS
jgi:hypothetical protein